MKTVPTEVRNYFSKIGRKGGSISRRDLSSEAAREMVKVREARRAFREFHAECFWYMPRDLNVSKEDIPAIVRGLRQNGGRQGFLIADKLCR